MTTDRRSFLKHVLAMGGGTLVAPGLKLSAFEPMDVDNPLAGYPARGWEKIYRDQYAYDRYFDWVCSPNDTHSCRVRGYVRNGTIVRMGADYEHHRIKDLYGNQASHNWGPRQCAKGYTFQRVVYGPYRLKYPLIRRGWKQWAEDGFPVLTTELRTKYKFDSRGTDELVKCTWDEAFQYIAKGYVAIAKAYSGDEGRKRLLDQGYPVEMVDETHGAGTRCMKFRGGMGLLGVIGKYGAYRLANSMALLDAKVRGVSEKDALGGRRWSNYTWHGDQAPGHPWVHGLQASDCDFNDLRFSKLIIMDGKNLVENKMTDSHWFIEVLERGGKIVVIAPEYGAPSTKADYWIPIREATDASLFLGIAHEIIRKNQYDEAFVKQFTDLPLLVRLDTLKRLRAAEVFPEYQSRLAADGPSLSVQGMTKEQHEQVGDFVVWDRKTGKPAALTRDEVGARLVELGVDPALEGRFTVKIVGQDVAVAPLFDLYRVHLEDYDVGSVAEMTSCPKDLIAQLAEDCATIKPLSIHQGEGINHWFHATEMNRAKYLVLMLTGNIGKPGAGGYTWAGNYKAALFQGSPWTGPGFKGWVTENPFHPNLDPAAHGKDVKVHSYARDEEPAYWNHGDIPLIVETPKYGRRCFTGKTHMPTPTKALFFNNVNLLNNAKHAYMMLKNVNPRIDMIITADIQMTSSVEYADFALPANSWVEFRDVEITASCSNPFLQIWKGGIPPVFVTKDDLTILAGIAKALGRETGESRFHDYFKFEHDGQRKIYMQRLLDTSTTTAGYTVDDIMNGKYGPKGAALMLFRTYPRIPFWEQIHESEPFFTDTGRMNAYSDLQEAIDYGENFIVHREGPEATPYLPNVIVSSNPLVRPDDYGIDKNAEHWDERTIRNVKLPWREVKQSRNFLWEKGFQFFLLTPKTRHRVHSQWGTVDWHLVYDSNFGDPYRLDRRTPGIGEHQMHMNPEAARALGIADGDYVWVDANPADRPYPNADPNDPFTKVARCMVRVMYNPAYPYNTVMMKHAPYIATEKSVKAHETREDGRAVSEGTGYQANFRYGSHQSCTRNWHMPMHQTDTLFHKGKAFTGFIFGGEADNHAVNTVPKETLVKVTKAEDGGLGGKEIWHTATRGGIPGDGDEVMKG